MPTDYCGNMIYENGVLKQILVDGGYITFSGTTPNYFYYLKDHLGNNRVVLTPSGTPIQVNHYYPFGGLFGESTGGSTQRFMYNGKELDRMHGLDWYDYGARHMTPDVGRFTTIDPMAEKYYSISPYAYCANNPVNAIDTDGKKIVFANGVSESFKKDFAIAAQYLIQHNVGNMLKELDASPTIYYISESLDDKNYFDAANRTISWKSRMGIETNELHYLSPATLLNHEIDHANEYNRAPKEFNESTIPYDFGDKDEFYYSPEEKRVITGSEQITAKALGEITDEEVTRTDHFGYHILMTSPISNKPYEEREEIIIRPNN